MRFRHVWPGAILTGLLWRGALWAFSWYAARPGALERGARLDRGGRDLPVLGLHLAVILLYGVEMTAGYARLRAAAVSIRRLQGSRKAIRDRHQLRPKGPAPFVTTGTSAEITGTLADPRTMFLSCL